jgi:hypothetical protein
MYVPVGTIYPTKDCLNDKQCFNIKNSTKSCEITIDFQSAHKNNFTTARRFSLIHSQIILGCCFNCIVYVGNWWWVMNRKTARHLQRIRLGSLTGSMAGTQARSRIGYFQNTNRECYRLMHIQGLNVLVHVHKDFWRWLGGLWKLNEGLGRSRAVDRRFVWGKAEGKNRIYNRTGCFGYVSANEMRKRVKRGPGT